MDRVARDVLSVECPRNRFSPRSNTGPSGDRCEREVVDRHLNRGIKAESYPFSGTSRFRRSSHDVDARKNGAGFTQPETWLGGCDLPVLRRSHADPIIVLPRRTWAALLTRGRR